jgi:hypothetical protein
MRRVLSVPFVVVLPHTIEYTNLHTNGDPGREPESFTDIARTLPAPGVIVTRLTWPEPLRLARNQ